MLCGLKTLFLLLFSVQTGFDEVKDFEKFKTEFFFCTTQINIDFMVLLIKYLDFEINKLQNEFGLHHSLKLK